MNSHETNSLLTLIQPEKLFLAIILILILSFSINVYGIWWGLPSYRGWAPDEIIPGKVFNGVIKGFSNGWHERHPPLHFYFLAVLYSPFIALHLLDVIDVRSLPTYTVLFYLGRFLSVLMGTGTVLVVYLCGREIYDQKASLFAALITALIFPFIHFSKTANLDVPYIFWFALSLLFYVRVLKHHKVNDYLLFAVTAVMSICTKDQAYGFYILTSVFIVLSHYRYERQRNSEARAIDSLIDRRILLSLLLAVVLFLTLHNVLFNLDGFLAHIRLTTGGTSTKDYQIFANSIPGHLEMFWQSLKHLGFSFGWPISLMCLLGLLIQFIQREKNPLLLSILIPGLSYYIFFISVILFNYVRYLIPLCIIFAFFGGKFLSDVLSRSRMPYGAKIFLTGAVFLYTFVYSFSINVLMNNDSRYYVEEWMEQNIVDGSSTVLGIGYRHFLPRLENFGQSTRTWETNLPEIDINPVKRMSDSEAAKRLLKDFGLAPHAKIIDPSEQDLTRAVAEIRPDYIVTLSEDESWSRGKKKAKAYEFFSRLDHGEVGYQLLLKYKSSPSWNLLNFDDIITGGAWINPEIKIFKKL